MDKRKRRKIVVITACIVVLLGVFLGVEYNKYREKPLTQALPVSFDDIARVTFVYPDRDEQSVHPDDQQASEFFDILDGCSVKFWSANPGLPNHYADAWFYVDTMPTERTKDFYLSFSTDGHVRVSKFSASGNSRSTIYQFVTGEEAVDRKSVV